VAVDGVLAAALVTVAFALAGVGAAALTIAALIVGHAGAWSLLRNMRR
jgi:uncharacterized membrane protein YuzA (DUF378 family)